MRQTEKSKNIVNPWENGNNITKMSSISVTKHNAKDTFGCPFCVGWGTRRFAPCSARHSRSGIRFAFEPKADGSSLTGGSAKNPRRRRKS